MYFDGMVQKRKEFSGCSAPFALKYILFSNDGNVEKYFFNLYFHRFRKFCDECEQEE